jgi:YVTN family beta-propeller protein
MTDWRRASPLVILIVLLTSAWITVAMPTQSIAEGPHSAPAMSGSRPQGYGSSTSPEAIPITHSNGARTTYPDYLLKATAISGSPRPNAAGPGSTGGISIAVGSNPGETLFDKENGFVYVIQPTSSNLTVINGTTVIGSVVVGQSPEFGVVDDRNGYVYVPNYFAGSVSVVSGTKVVGTVYDSPETGPDLSYPYDIAYDEADGYTYATNSVADNVSVINGSRLSASINVGSSPEYATYDSLDHYVYVTNYESHSVSVINGTKVIATVQVGSFPEYATCDTENGYVYVSNTNTSNVSVINGTQLAGTINVGHDPSIAAFDGGNGFVYVPNDDSDNVSIINGTHLIHSVSVGSLPDAAVYDSGNGFIYVPNYGTNNVVYDNVSIINGTSILGSVKVGFQPDDPTYDSLNGNIYVPNYDSSNVSVVYSIYPVTFTTGGLPPGTAWWVNITGQPTLFTNAPVLSVNEYDGAYLYSVSTIDKTFSALGGTLVVNGATSLLIQFSRVTYQVAFTGTGLPVGTNWSVKIRENSVTDTYSSETSTIRFQAPNGTCQFALGTLPGWTTESFEGSFTINGRAVNQSIAWAQVTYSVVFTESGLPTGTEWWVNVTGAPPAISAAPGLTLNEHNGTYIYSLSTTDLTYFSPGGSFTVDDAPLSEFVDFVRVAYFVNFTENGLPSGTSWSVTLGGTLYSTSTGTISINESNGTYLYTLGGVPGSTTSSFSGSIVVDGMAASKVVTWTQVTYRVAFTAVGLPSVTIWSVTLDGIQQSSFAIALAFARGNGTYSFLVGTMAGYGASPGSGSVPVSGANVTKTIDFAAISLVSPPTPTFLGLPQTDGYALLIGIAAAAVAVALGVVVWRRRGERPPRIAPSSASGGPPAT